MPNTFIMPDFLGQQEQLLQGVERLNQEFLQMDPTTDAAVKALPKGAKIMVDQRDLDVMALMIPPGADQAQRIQDMYRAFSVDDPVLRKPWLDMLYDFRDELEIDQLDLNRPEDVRRAVMCTVLDQTMGTMADYNRDYYDARYRDPVQLAKMKLQDDTHIQFSCLVETMAIRENRGLRATVTIPHNSFGTVDAQNMLACSMFRYQQQVKGEEFDVSPLIGSPHFKCYLGRSIDQVQPLPARYSEAEDAVRWALIGGFEQLDATGKTGLKRNDLVLIDGKSINEIIDEKHLTLTGPERQIMSNQILGTALVNGRNRIHTVSITQDASGEVKTQLQEVKPDLTHLGETKSLEYSRFRRFFDWGLTKCKTPAERVEKMHSKPIPKKMAQQLHSAVDVINGKVDEYRDTLPTSTTSQQPTAQREATNAKTLSAEMPMKQPNPQKLKDRSAAKQDSKTPLATAAEEGRTPSRDR